MKAPVMRAHTTREGASQALAAWIMGEITSVLARQPRAVIALPGGETPKMFLAALAALPLDWARLTLMPTDERCVPAGHPRSNEAMFRRIMPPLTEGLCRFVSFHAEGREPLARTIGDRVLHEGLPDIVVSGMGDDGHVASLFPGDASWTFAIGDTTAPPVLATSPPHLEQRLSLSPVALACAPARALLISGDVKRGVLANALRHEDIARFPVLTIAGGETPLHVFCA